MPQDFHIETSSWRRGGAIVAEGAFSVTHTFDRETSKALCEAVWTAFEDHGVKVVPRWPAPFVCEFVSPAKTVEVKGRLTFEDRCIKVWLQTSSLAVMERLSTRLFDRLLECLTDRRKVPRS